MICFAYRKALLSCSPVAPVVVAGLPTASATSIDEVLVKI